MSDHMIIVLFIIALCGFFLGVINFSKVISLEEEVKYLKELNEL